MAALFLCAVVEWIVGLPLRLLDGLWNLFF